MHNLTKIKYFRVLLWITYPLSQLIFFPFIAFKKTNGSHLFFFFDRYALGGAQRVYLDILESVEDIQKRIFFTRKSPNTALKKDFYSFPNTDCSDIHFWCDNLFFRLFAVHYYAMYLNKHKNAIMLGSNSTFFYDMLPFIKKNNYKIELLHNFSYGKKGMEFFGLANYKYLDKRLVIDKYTLENIIAQYKEFRVPSSYIDRVDLIEFGVLTPDNLSKDFGLPLRILYAGRGTAQKRIWLLNQIVEYFLAHESPVKFTFAGSMANELSALVKEHCIIYDEIGDKETLNKLYQQSHAIILTSSFEGFPMVIKEGMSFGCIPIVTALPGNKTHLKHLYNALLIENPEDEQKVVQNAINNMQLLIDNHALIASLSTQAYEYARTHFRKDSFLNRYRELLKSRD